MNRSRKGIFAPSRLRLALLAGATLSCASLQAQTTTVISDTFGSATGPLHDRLPDTTVNGARWISDANFTLAGSNSVTATFASAYQTACIDLGTAYFSTPGVYTLSADVDYAAGTKAGGNVGVSFMSILDSTGGNNQTIVLRDQLPANQTNPANAGCVEYAKGGAGFSPLTGAAIGGTDSPFTLTVVLVVKASGYWQMNSYITNRTTGQTFYPRGSTGTRSITSPSAIRYVGLLAGGGIADAPVINNFKLTRAPVIEPAFYYLDSDQINGHDWLTTGHWNTQPTGLGTDATLLADVHDYFTNNHVLRSPMVSTPVKFPGGSLTIDGGGLELRQTSAAAEVTINNLVSRGGFITNSAGAWVTRLNASNLAVTKTGMDTILSPNGSTRTLSLSLGRLAGAGTLDIHGGGTVQLAAGDATRFTGKITKAAGTSLHLQGPISSKASVVISTPAEVNLNGNTLTVAALTVAGSVKSPNSYDAATLGFAGTGTVIVQTPPADAETLFGVNLAVAEFGDVPGRMGYEYAYPTEAEFDYYNARGIKLIRLPFRWERIQRIFPDGALDNAEVAQIDLVLTRAAARGMKVILDMHNGNGRYVNGASYRIGATTTVTNAHYAAVWEKIAAKFGSYPAVYGYDIMNEPGGDQAPWMVTAQAAVDAIRNVDTKNFIIVENTGFSGAQYWKLNTPLDSVNDGLFNKMIYSAHSYWDDDFNDEKWSGVYNFSYDQQAAHPNLGVEKAKIYVDWLNARGARGFVGEYGVPNNPAGAFADIRWNNMLFRFLQYLEFNGISGTYWAGGPRWTLDDQLSCEPTTLTLPDRPVMPVLRAFGFPVVYEAESLSAVATPSFSLFAEPQMNGGSSKGLNSTAAGNSISFTLPNVPKGKYQVFVRVKKYTSRGKFELFIDGSSTRQGTEQDQYSTTVSYPELDLGAVTFSATGNRVFQFRCSGKNASSTAYTLTFDSIRLQPLGL